MKRLSLSVILIWAGILCYAQPSSFFGLTFGEKYSQDQMITAVGLNGTFEGHERSGDNNGIGLDAFVFSNVKFEGRIYLFLTLQVSQKDGRH